jgi:hypothetical protein
MKLLIAILFHLQMAFLTSFSANDTDLQQLRQTYLKAVEDSKVNDSLLQSLELSKNKSPVLLGYQGACEGLKAKHAFNPYKKLDYLKKSQQTLTNAIAQAPTNVEIRFLRFSMQHYLPAFLGHSKNIEEDRIAIVRYINSDENKQLGKQTIQIIAKFLIDSKRCSTPEIQFLREFSQ